MDTKIENLMKDIPDIFSFNPNMEIPNDSIEIHEGLFEIFHDEQIVKIEGKIYFGWFPNTGARFEGVIISNNEDALNIVNHDNTLNLRLDGLVVGKCRLTQISIQDNINVEGIMIGNCVKGDKSIAASLLRFTIPNLRGFFGDSVKFKKGDEIMLTRSRIVFENNAFIITIDKHLDFDNLYKMLKDKGGYITLYTGEIKSKNGIISHDDFLKLNNCIRNFLTFLNGRRCSLHFIHGIHDKETIWIDYTSYLTDQYKTVISWPQKHSIDGLNELWIKFSDLWKNENDRDFLVSAIHWYIEANSNSGFVEGSIIMVQIALELIYNWLIIEKLELLKGKDAEAISASNKIRLLLSQVKCNTSLPDSLPNLKTYITTNKIDDGIEGFVQIRNAIIHSQEEKRRNLGKIPSNVLYEAQQLGIWYLEVSMLHILEYKGKYYNRCLGKKWSGEGEEFLPSLCKS